MPRISSLLQTAFLLSAASLAGCAVAPATHLVSAPGSTHQQLFNQGWRFKLLTADADPAALAADESKSVDDASWRKLDLPHDWSIEQPFDQKYASGTGFLPGLKARVSAGGSDDRH